MGLTSGVRLGPYEIISSLGAGGMGEVYRARDTRLGRHVAIKVLPASDSGDLTSRARFEREARTISTLSHPNICPLFDIGDQDGHLYLVMECLEGHTLAATLTAGGLPLDRAFQIAAQIADGLAHAHAAGIIHRDLKPGNIMVLPNGSIKILDFGLARKLTGSTDATVANLTEAGAVSGTIAYMSPEQTLGKTVDLRSDLFSLGVVLYEMLCGMRPFSGASAFSIMQNVVSAEPVAVDTVRPGVPPTATALLQRLMAKAPEQRPASAAEVAAVLRQLAAMAPAAGVASSAAASPTITIAGRRGPARTRWFLPAAIVVTVIAVISGALWLRPPPPPVPSAMPPASLVPAPTTALEHTQLGLGLLRRFDRAGAVEKAQAAFEAAIAIDKAYAPAWAGLARAYWRQQKDTRDQTLGARAEDAAKQAIALDPYLADGHVSLGMAHLVAGDISAARKAFDHALVIDPANAGGHRGLGDIADGEDRLQDATDHYRRAMDLDRTDWELPRLLGDMPYKAARYAEALSWYGQAASAAPDSTVPLRLMGAASHMLGDYPGAARAFQRSLAIQPSASTYTNLGTALFYQGLYRESLQAFERAVEMFPSDPLLWGNVADAYRWVPGNAPRAQEAYARAIQLLRERLQKDPKHLANRSRLALYLAKSGSASSGVAELAALLGPDVREVNTLYRGAVTYELAGDRESALTTLGRALDRGYSLSEISMDPELAKLRNDVRYHRMVARLKPPVAAK